MKDFIKQKLNESLVHNIIEEMLVGEDYPTHFDRDHFAELKTFKDRVRYCEENLKRISSGTGRIVYMIDDKMVLKLAKNQKGVAQVSTEVEWGTNSYFSDILAHTFAYDHDDLWVEMELARKVTKAKFREIVGCDIDDMYMYLRNRYEKHNRRKDMFGLDPALVEELNENQFVSSIFEFMLNTGSGVGDFGRLNSYGLVKRNGEDDIVIIDFGLTDDIYDSYYR